VAKQAEFNGTKLLDGSFLGQLFQVGGNSAEMIAIGSTADARVAELGQITSSGPSGAFGSFLINSPGDSMTMSVGGVSIINESGPQILDAAFVDDAIADAADNLLAAGIIYTGSVAGGDLRFSQINGETFSINLAQAGGGGGFAGADFNFDTFSAPNIRTGTATITAQKGFEDLDLLTVDGATRAILSMDAALGEVNAARADLGAVQNRFASVVANLNTSSENLTASRSRIRDADYAKETAELTRTQILQQAGTAMLAQANQIPQNVLSLLR